MKQTAVEWLIKQFSNVLGKIQTKSLKDSVFLIDAIEQAKEIEKQQIKDAYDQGSEAGYELAKNDDFIEGFKMKEAEQYYNETFKTK